MIAVMKKKRIYRNKYPIFSLRLPPDMREALDNAARRHWRTPTEEARNLLREFLEREGFLAPRGPEKPRDEGEVK